MAIIPAPGREIQLSLSQPEGDLLRRTRGSLPDVSRALHEHVLERTRERMRGYLRVITCNTLVRAIKSSGRNVYMTTRRNPIVVDAIVGSVAVGQSPWANVLLSLPLWGENGDVGDVCKIVASTIGFPLTVRVRDNWFEVPVNLEPIATVQLLVDEQPTRKVIVLRSELSELTTNLITRGASFHVAA